MCVGETLELASFLSLSLDDVPSFLRYFQQLKLYYIDYGDLLPSSERAAPLLGLYMLYLLSHNQITQFHMEYELFIMQKWGGDQGGALNSPVVPPSPTARSTQNPLMSTPYLKFVINLEQQLMEGCYNRILNMSKETYPLPLYGKFMSILVDTVRDKIADCSEVAYISLPLSEAAKLFHTSLQSLPQFISKHPTWTIQGDRLFFNYEDKEKVKAGSKDTAALGTIKQMLDYATELERIV